MSSKKKRGCACPFLKSMLPGADPKGVAKPSSSSSKLISPKNCPEFYMKKSTKPKRKKVGNSPDRPLSSDSLQAFVLCRRRQTEGARSSKQTDLRPSKSEAPFSHSLEFLSNSENPKFVNFYIVSLFRNRNKQIDSANWKKFEKEFDI